MTLTYLKLFRRLYGDMTLAAYARGEWRHA